MEPLLLGAIFAIAIAAILYGLGRREFVWAMLGAIFLIVAGGILYSEGYNSYVICENPDDPGDCSERVHFTYDSNQLVTQADTNVLKVNANRSGLSSGIGQFSVGIGIIVALVALLGKVNSG